MEVSDPQIPDRSRRRWPSVLSLIVWGAIGLVAGFVVGGLAVEVSGGQGVGGTVVNVSVQVFGITVRRGVGPEAMDPEPSATRDLRHS